jgi:hypothetical protein
MLRQTLLLLALHASCSSYYVPLGSQSVREIHKRAKRHVKQKSDDEALRLYQAATVHGQLSQSFLLLALHHQRYARAAGAEDERQLALDSARAAFRDGLVLRKQDESSAALLQAWALLESKDGNMHRAVLLLRRASHLDRERVRQAFSWKLFRDYIRERNPLARPRAMPGGTRDASSAVSGTCTAGGPEADRCRWSAGIGDDPASRRGEGDYSI